MQVEKPPYLNFYPKNLILSILSFCFIAFDTNSLCVQVLLLALCLD